MVKNDAEVVRHNPPSTNSLSLSLARSRSRSRSRSLCLSIALSLCLSLSLPISTAQLPYLAVIVLEAEELEHDVVDEAWQCDKMWIGHIIGLHGPISITHACMGPK